MKWENTIKKRKRITEDFQFDRLLDEFTGMRDSLIKELQKLKIYSRKVVDGLMLLIKLNVIEYIYSQKHLVT